MAKTKPSKAALILAAHADVDPRTAEGFLNGTAAWTCAEQKARLEQALAEHPELAPEETRAAS